MSAHAHPVQPPTPTPTQEPTKATIRLRAMSWNVHGLVAPFSKARPQRLRRIAAEVAAQAPDLVAFQEAWAGSVRMLEQALPGYAARWSRSRGGSARGGLLVMVRDDGNWKFHDESSMRFRRFSTAGPSWKLWQGDGFAGKGASFHRLECRESRRDLWFVNAHLQARYRRNGYRDVRLAQLRELSSWLHDLGGGAPIVLGGDFNTPPDEHELYSAITGLGVDVTSPAHSQPGAVTNYPTHSDVGWIDYLLVRPLAGQRVAGELQLIRNRAVDDPFSDHHGLVVDLRLD